MSCSRIHQSKDPLSSFSSQNSSHHIKAKLLSIFLFQALRYARLQHQKWYRSLSVRSLHLQSLQAKVVIAKLWAKCFSWEWILEFIWRRTIISLDRIELSWLHQTKFCRSDYLSNSDELLGRKYQRHASI